MTREEDRIDKTAEPLDTVVVCHPERLMAAATAAVLRSSGAARTTMTVPSLTRLLSYLHRGVDVGLGGKEDLGLHLAGAGVEDVGGARAGEVAALSVDEVRNGCAHDCPLADLAAEY